MILNIIGYTAALLTLINMLPQVIKSYRTKSVEDVSFLMVLIFALSMVLWTVYGVMIKSTPIIIADAVGFVISVVEIILIFRYRKK